MQPESPVSESPTPAPKRNESLIAGGLLLLCLLTAVGNWIYGVRPRETKPEDSSSLSSSLFDKDAELGVIVIEGTIMHKAEGSGFGSQGAASDRIVEAIRRAEKDEVKGLLLKINSPGGT